MLAANSQPEQFCMDLNSGYIQQSRVLIFAWKVSLWIGILFEYLTIDVRCTEERMSFHPSSSFLLCNCVNHTHHRSLLSFMYRPPNNGWAGRSVCDVRNKPGHRYIWWFHLWSNKKVFTKLRETIISVAGEEIIYINKKLL